MTATSMTPGILAALTVGLLLQPLVLRVMTAAAILDVPSERSSHTVTTPRGGGVGVALAATAGLMLDSQVRTIAVPLLLFALIGLADDLRGVSIRVRLIMQSLAGIATGVVLVPDGMAGPVQIAVVLAVAVWLMGYVNAFNFMDGINGISAVHAMLAGTVYAVFGVIYELPVLAVAGTVAAAAASTFLPWNAVKARIFLGDVGSYGLGGLLGALAVYGVFHGVPLEAAVAPLALYFADTGWTLICRKRRGEAWYRPHRTHAYQRLTDVGWSHQRVTIVTAIISATVSVAVLAAVRSGPLVRIGLDASAAFLLIAYLASPSWLAARPRQRKNEDRKVYA